MYNIYVSAIFNQWSVYDPSSAAASDTLIPAPCQCHFAENDPPPKTYQLSGGPIVAPFH